MPEGQHQHVMNAHAANPKYGTKRPDGSDEPEYIPHPDPVRAGQTDMRCVTCGKSHDELIPANDPSRNGVDPTLPRRKDRVEVKSESKPASAKKSSPKSKSVGKGKGVRSRGDAARGKAPASEVTHG